MNIYENINKKLNEFDITIPSDPSDGWGEDVLDLLDDFFNDVEAVAYEVRNARRGSYAGFGSSIDQLSAKLDEIADQASDLARTLRDSEVNTSDDEEDSDEEI